MECWTGRSRSSAVSWEETYTIATMISAKAKFIRTGVTSVAEDASRQSKPRYYSMLYAWYGPLQKYIETNKKQLEFASGSNNKWQGGMAGDMATHKMNWIPARSLHFPICVFFVVFAIYAFSRFVHFLVVLHKWFSKGLAQGQRARWVLVPGPVWIKVLTQHRDF